MEAGGSIVILPPFAFTVYDRLPFLSQDRLTVRVFVSTVIPSSFLMNVPVAVAVFPLFVAEADLRLQSFW